MSTREQTQPPGLVITRSFYLAMSVLLAAIVGFGFSHTVPHDLQPPGLPILFRLHAAVFVTWVFLFVAQPAFIRAGSVTLHRRLGVIGAMLAVAMVALGASSVLFALHAGTLPPFYAPGLFLLRNLGSMLVFAVLITAAIFARRQPDWHKRLILCAAIVIATPGFERSLPVFNFGPHWYLVIDALVICTALLGPILDLLTRHRIHPAYLYGLAAILSGQAITDIFATAPFLTPVLHALGAV